MMLDFTRVFLLEKSTFSKAYNSMCSNLLYICWSIYLPRHLTLFYLPLQNFNIILKEYSYATEVYIERVPGELEIVYRTYTKIQPGLQILPAGFPQYNYTGIRPFYNVPSLSWISLQEVNFILKLFNKFSITFASHYFNISSDNVVVFSI